VTEQPRIELLYLVYWGAAEPLGRSLVLPPVQRFESHGVATALITFEKAAHLHDRQTIHAIGQGLAESGVRWLSMRYHKWPKWPATAFDIVSGVVRGLLAHRRTSFQMIHARTFVGGVMGLVLAKLAGTRWVYHNEGFYPDEQVDAGVWRAGSLPHRVAKLIEKQLYQRADGVIVLSERARQEIVARLEARGRTKPHVQVVPSAVDLARFPPAPRPPAGNETPLQLLYVGSVGQRYQLDRIGRFVAAFAARRASRLRVLSPAPEEVVRSLLERGGLARELWNCEWVPHERIPDTLAQCHAGVHFLAQGLSEHAGSPTKFGEYWAAGLPIVTTPKVGDSEEIIQRERVGVIVRSHDDEGHRRAIDELLALLADPDLAQPCRRAAEAHYSLDSACRDQVALYRNLLG
jgi:glycosyltransferase involved in cell wall biosynthesis